MNTHPSGAAKHDLTSFAYVDPVEGMFCMFFAFDKLRYSLTRSLMNCYTSLYRIDYINTL